MLAHQDTTSSCCSNHTTGPLTRFATTARPAQMKRKSLNLMRGLTRLRYTQTHTQTDSCCSEVEGPPQGARPTLFG